MVTNRRKSGRTNRILDDLVALLDPRWMEVRGDFNPRGNVHTVVVARHQQEGWCRSAFGK
jgi:7-cyano-7-deazaguanine reductase